MLTLDSTIRAITIVTDAYDIVQVRGRSLVESKITARFKAV